MNIKEFISAIQKRPKMYVEEVRLDYMQYRPEVQGAFFKLDTRMGQEECG